MNANKNIVRWARVPGLLSLGAAAVLAGCEAPTALTPDDSARVDLVSYQAKKTSAQPAVPSLCDTCLVDVNVKHGNSSGPINLNGIRNGQASSDGTDGQGAELTVSVLGTLDFDISLVDMSTVTLGDVETLPNVTHVSSLNKKYQASIVDLNGDGILDLLLHFNISDMVTNGDLSETTTSLCLYGEGPDYIINGCGGVSVGDDDDGGSNGNGGNDKVVYETDHAFQLFGRDNPSPVRVIQYQYLSNPEDPAQGYPGWSTLPVADLNGSGAVTGDYWRTTNIPIGSQSASASGVNFLQGCGLTPSDPSYPVKVPGEYRWQPKYHLLARTDLTFPAGTKNVYIEFLVDDEARFYFNGVELTNGFKSSGAAGTCVTYGKTITMRVPDSLLSPDGINKIGVWAWDSGGFVNWIDFRVMGDIPVTP